MQLKSTHLITGVMMVVIFLASGLYMRLQFPELYDGEAAVRFLYRANHIYLLAAGMLNMVLGLYLQRASAGKCRHLQTVGSVLCMLACPLLLAAFFIEPPQQSPARPLTAFGFYALFGGVLAHLAANWRKK